MGTENGLYRRYAAGGDAPLGTRPHYVRSYHTTAGGPARARALREFFGVGSGCGVVVGRDGNGAVASEDAPRAGLDGRGRVGSRDVVARREG